MFDNRCMYYLTIVVVMLFSVSFIKLNKFWELDVRYGEVESDESMGTTIFKGVRFLIGIVLILMPGIMNPVYQSTEGMIVECVKADPVWRRGMACYRGRYRNRDEKNILQGKRFEKCPGRNES